MRYFFLACFLLISPCVMMCAVDACIDGRLAYLRYFFVLGLPSGDDMDWGNGNCPGEEGRKEGCMRGFG